MTEPVVRRTFEVEAPLGQAWHRLADVERWPEWAAHIRSVDVSPPGERGPRSRSAFHGEQLGPSV